MIKWLLAACILTSCIAPQPQMAPIQIMPYHDSGVRAGCVRAVARLVIQSQAFALWPMDRIYQFCDEVQQSYYDELRTRRNQST